MTERELLGKLNSIRIRARLMLLLYGVGLLAAVVVAGFLLPVAADYLIHLPGAVRLAIGLCLLTVLGYSLWRFLWLPVRARITLDDVAIKLEARFPQFNDRLASAVNFITHPDSQGDVSEVLVREVVRDSGESTRNVPLGKVLTAKATTMGMLIGLVGVAALLAVLIVNPAWARTGFDRMFRPLSDTQWPQRYSLEPLTRGGLVPVGESFTAKMRVANGRTPEAYVYYKKGDKDWQKPEKMQRREENGQTIYFVDEPFRNLQIDESFTYYFVVSEGLYWSDREIRSPDYTVTVVPRPRVESARYTIVYPDYMKQEPRSADLTSGREVKARRDATVQVDMKLDTRQTAEPLGRDNTGRSAFALKYTPRLANGKTGPTTQREVSQAPGRPNEFRFTTPVAESFQVEPVLVDSHGFNNQYPGYTALYVFDAVADRRPEVSMHIEGDRGRTEELEVEPENTVKFNVSANDDYRVETTQLVIRVGKKDTKNDAFDAIAPQLVDVTVHRVKDETGEDRYAIEGVKDLKLTDMGIKVDDVLQVRPRATDNSQPQNVTDGNARKIRVVSLADLAKELVKKAPEEIKKLLAAETGVKKSTDALLDELGKRPPTGDDVQQLDNLSARQAAIREDARQVQEKFDNVAQRMADKKLDDPNLKDQVAMIGKSLGEVGEKMREAEAELARAANAVSPARNKPTPSNPSNQGKPSNPSNAGSQPDNKSGQPNAGDPKAGDPKAGDPKSGDPKAGDPKAGDPKAGDPKSGDPKAGDPKAGDPKAGDPKAGDPKAGDPKAGQPSAGKPSPGQPSAGQPSAGQPSAGQPSAGQPSAGQPSAGQPSAGQPSPGQPSPGQPPAGQPPSPQNHTQNASAHQGQAIKDLNKLLDKVQQMSNLADILKELERILKVQQAATKLTGEMAPTTVGKTIEQLDQAMVGKLKDLEGNQSKLAGDMDKVIVKMGDVAAAIAQSDAIGARALKEAADIGTQGDAAAKQASAAVNLSQVHLPEAITDQQAAEEVITAMIQHLKDRKDRELATFDKRLEELAQAIEKLIAREKEHIADNEAAQKKDAANAEFQKQSKEQQQTKGNTEQVAGELKDMEMPDAAKAAGQAAGSMGQAAGKLGKAGKPAAGQPGQPGQPGSSKDAQKDQEDAVKYLEDTKDEIKKKQDELKKQQQDEQRAKLIEQLKAIREVQVKQVNDPTDKVFQAKPKEEDLTRQDDADLGKLAAKQQDVHTQTGKISEEVKQESVVISWLLEKVVVGMGESRKGLIGQSDLPGKPGRRGHYLEQTRDEQVRLVNRLNEIIDALEEEQKKSTSNPPPPGGGKPGKSKPPPLVPPVAELKLLRAMEKDILERTVYQDKKAIPGKVDTVGEKKVKRLGDDQNKIRDLTIDMVKKLQSNGNGGGAPPDPAVDPQKIQDDMKRMNVDK